MLLAATVIPLRLSTRNISRGAPSGSLTDIYGDPAEAYLDNLDQGTNNLSRVAPLPMQEDRGLPLYR